MHDTSSAEKEFDDLFRKARAQSLGQNSIMPEIQERIAATHIRRSLRPFYVLATTAALLTLCVPLWRYSRQDAATADKGTISWQAASSLQVDGVDVTIHMAAMVAPRAVVVVWSCPDDASSQTEPEDGQRVGKYRHYTLPLTQHPTGRRANAQLYIADEGVRPMMEPPSIALITPRHSEISFGMSPQQASAATLAQNLHFEGPTSQACLAVDDIYREIDQHTR